MILCVGCHSLGIEDWVSVVLLIQCVQVVLVDVMIRTYQHHYEKITNF